MAPRIFQYALNAGALDGTTRAVRTIRDARVAAAKLVHWDVPCFAQLAIASAAAAAQAAWRKHVPTGAGNVVDESMRRVARGP